jgi:hypothetical protein
MAITATAMMIAITIKTNETPELFVVGLGVGVGPIICATLELTKK